MQLNHVHLILVGLAKKKNCSHFYAEYLEICGLYLESNGVYGFLFKNTYSWTSRLLSLFWFSWRLQKEELKCAQHDAIHKVGCYSKCMRKIFGKYADIWIFVRYTYSWTSRFLSLFWFCWRLQEEEELKCVGTRLGQGGGVASIFVRSFPVNSSGSFGILTMGCSLLSFPVVVCPVVALKIQHVLYICNCHDVYENVWNYVQLNVYILTSCILSSNRGGVMTLPFPLLCIQSCCL